MWIQVQVCHGILALQRKQPGGEGVKQFPAVGQFCSLWCCALQPEPSLLQQWFWPCRGMRWHSDGVGVLVRFFFVVFAGLFQPAAFQCERCFCVFTLQNIKVLDASAAKSTKTTEVSILAFLGGLLCCQTAFIFLGR